MSKVKYVSGPVLIPKNGQVWRFGDSIKSALSDGVTTKSADLFGGVDQAMECAEIWKGMGYKGWPSSPVSFWRQKLFELKRAGLIPNCGTSVNQILRTAFSPSWVDWSGRGAYPGEWFEYDLNTAYLWGSQLPLPTMVTMYKRGDSDYLKVIKGWPEREDLPPFLRRSRCVVTDKCVETWGLEIEDDRVVEAFGLHSRKWGIGSALSDVIATLPPKAGKSLSRGYWGVWASDGLLVRETYRSGELVSRTETRNRELNLVLASLITRRVHHEIADAINGRDVIRVYTDSIITRDQMRTGGAPGEWSLDSHYPYGVWMEAPGRLHDLRTAHVTEKAKWRKRSGC